MILTTMEMTMLYNMVIFKSAQNQSSAWYAPSMQCDLLKETPPLLPHYKLNIPLMTLWLLGGLNLPLESTINCYWTKSLHNSPTTWVLLGPLSSVKCAISWNQPLCLICPPINPPRPALLHSLYPPYSFPPPQPPLTPPQTSQPPLKPVDPPSTLLTPLGPLLASDSLSISY